MSLLVLFDIDGTLILSGRAGVRGMNVAFKRIYGCDDALEGLPIAGRTDRAIVLDAMKRQGIDPTDDAVDALRDLYVECLREEIAKPNPGHPSLVLPGVWPLLDALASRDDVTVALLTGNFRSGAGVKLSHFKLWDRFGFGAFGDHHVDRRALVPIAMNEAARAGIGIESASSVIVIGDTPADVDCAKAHGARALAVATGSYDRRALESSGADIACETLENVEELVDWMVG
jgi:phosphoglycolate phosphatase-like HAD superfamily hydrolase